MSSRQVLKRGPSILRSLLVEAEEGSQSSSRRAIHEVPSTRPNVEKAPAKVPERGPGLRDTLTRLTPKVSLPSLPHSARQAPSAVRTAIGMQLSALYRQHFNKIVGVGALLAVYSLWRLMYGVASSLLDLETSLIEYQFLALAMACTALFGVYLKNRIDINPSTVYRRAMLRLNTHPMVLERMGAPLIGSEVRATVTTGGHFGFSKGLLPKWSSRRCQMIFPLTGSERRGLVSVEAKKWKGQVVFKLLAVDVRDGRDESRIYLEGDSAVYNRGGVMRELRDPFLHALENENVYNREDELDEELEEQKEEEEAKKARPKSLEQGGGMFFYERVYYGIRDSLTHLTARLTAGAAGAGASPKP